MRTRSRLLAMVTLVFCITVQAQEPDQTQQNTPRPNIVLMFADDLGYGDLGSFGHPYIRTPNLDALAAAGQRWTDFYVAAPVCSPSRAALLSGRLPVRNGQYGDQLGVYFPNEDGGFPPQETTLAEALKAVGYRTAIFGKWHLGDKPHAWPTRHGFDQWQGVPYSNDMDWVNEPTLDEIVRLRAAGDSEVLAASLHRRNAKYANPQQGQWNVPFLSSRITEEGYEDKVLQRPAQQASLTKNATQSALEFIHAQDQRPFLLYLPFSMPHTPLFRGDEFIGKSLGGRYGDVIEELDWSVGEVVRALLSAGKIDNTLLIFTSDNGPWLSMGIEGGRQGLLNNGKGTTFEGGMRVPTIFWWPGQVRRDTVSEIGSTLDLFRTIAGLAGANASTATDSLDLSPVLMRGAASPRSEMPFYRGSTLYAYRYGDWKLHFITEGRYGLPPERKVHDSPLLFHLKHDPSERFNVAAQHPGVVAEIQKAVARHRQSITILPPAMDARLARLEGP